MDGLELLTGLVDGLAKRKHNMEMQKTCYCEFGQVLHKTITWHIFIHATWMAVK